jgi:tRNA (uracil-5-)-methyltransferase TRM9
MEQAQNLPKMPDEIRRYYHMFTKDELRGLVQLAAQEMGLAVDSPSLNEAEKVGTTDGVEIVANGWERSNYYIELRRWKR